MANRGLFPPGNGERASLQAGAAERDTPYPPAFSDIAAPSQVPAALPRRVLRMEESRARHPEQGRPTPLPTGRDP